MLGLKMQDRDENFIKLDLSNYDYLVNQSENALVLFTASWCGPCKMIKPKMPELAKEYQSRLRVFWVDAEECMDLVSQYKIQAVPFIATFKYGELMESKVTSNYTQITEMASRLVSKEN
jgi:thioredoxin 1